MIAVTRLDKQLMYLNPDHIICIEETPDTVITLFNGNRYIVKDKATAIISRIVVFRARISRRASIPSNRRYSGRKFAHRADWSRDTNSDIPSDPSDKTNNTPFINRNY